MGNWLKAGAFRICPLCEARNKAGAASCVKCRTDMRHASSIAAPGPARARSTPLMRMLLIGGLVAAIAAGLVVRSVFHPTLEDPGVADVRADERPMAAAQAPPPEVTGWVPGGSAGAVAAAAPAAADWSTATFPVARPNPYDVPGDPSQSMVGIAPNAGAVRRAAARHHVFTNDDLIGTRGGAYAAPAPEPLSNQ
jgi:hypothetical protein